MTVAPVFLLVEPSPLLRSVLCRWLENVLIGPRLLIASNGAEALELATHRIPSHVLIELSLPDRAGIEILIELRQALPDSQIIVTSWFEGDWLIDGVRSVGADGFVSRAKLYNDLLVLWNIFKE